MNNAVCRPRIVILCGDDAHHHYLISELSRHQNVVCAVIEHGVLTETFRQKKFRKWFVLLYHRVRRTLTGSADYRKSFFAVPGADALDETELPPMLRVGNINAEETVNAIRNASPDLIVVMGTGILKNSVLSACSAPIINIHGGCLPDYKGNHCFFFALLDRNFTKIASTIHLVDAGIDSGAIIARIHPTILNSDTAESLYCRAEKQAIEYLNRLIDVYGSNITELAYAQEKNAGHLYYTKDRTLGCELRMLKVRCCMKKNNEIIVEGFID